MQCSDRSDGAGQNSTDRADRQGQGRFEPACQFSAAKTVKALAGRFLGMAPLRLAGGSVAALFQPQQKPSGLLRSPVIGNRDRGLWQGSQLTARRSLEQR